MINKKTKGQSGEREAIALIQSWLEGTELKRNLNQWREGGHDVVGLEWLAIEVKRQETLHVNAWWKQTVEQASRSPGAIPFLMYRQNRKPWQFRTEVKHSLFGKRVALVVDLDVENAKRFVLANYLLRKQACS